MRPDTSLGSGRSRVSNDHDPAAASAGARLDAALDQRRADLPGGTSMTSRSQDDGDELPRAYPAEIVRDDAGLVVAHLPDLPEAPEVRGATPEEVLGRLPLALLTGLRGVVREGRPMPPPSPAQDRPLIEIPVEALPRLLLHQRMLAAGLDDAAVERRLGSVPGWSVALLRDPMVPIERPEPNQFDTDLVMAALWAVAGRRREAAFGPPGAGEEADDMTWSRQQAALLTLRLAGTAAPGLQVASVVDEVGSVGSTLMCAAEDHLRRGVQLLMEALAVRAAMGRAGEAPATLLLRRAAEAFFWADTHLNRGNLPHISLAETWTEARELTDTRLERLGLSIDAVPQQCPLDLKVLLDTYSDSDITLDALGWLTGEWPVSEPAEGDAPRQGRHPYRLRRPRP
jgi:predicted RNase H-like HicB family nuclease